MAITLLSIESMASAPSSDAEVANPSDAAAPQPANQPTEGRYRSWEYPVTVWVSKPARPMLRENGLIGPYRQPLWTAARRFPTTRVYVVPEGKMELEYWMRTTFKKDGTTSCRGLYEAEFGLPHRFKFGIYFRTDQDGDSGEICSSEQLELRYARADWGKLTGNPTLYIEWIRHDRRNEPDQIEPKLLIGGDLSPRWHWGMNSVGAFQTGGDLERELSSQRAQLCGSRLQAGRRSGVPGKPHRYA